jgi:hypothetical protein
LLSTQQHEVFGVEVVNERTVFVCRDEAVCEQGRNVVIAGHCSGSGWWSGTGQPSWICGDYHHQEPGPRGTVDYTSVLNIQHAEQITTTEQGLLIIQQRPVRLAGDAGR